MRTGQTAELLGLDGPQMANHCAHQVIVVLRVDDASPESPSTCYQSIMCLKFHAADPSHAQIAKRPRYSLVWKLVFFPAAGNLDADEEGKASSDASNVASRWEPSIALRVWGDPVRFGSAVAECGSNPPPVHAHRARETVDLVRPHEGAGDTVGAVSYVGDKEQRRGPERLDWQRLSLESVEVKAAGAKGRGVFATRYFFCGTLAGCTTLCMKHVPVVCVALMGSGRI